MQEYYHRFYSQYLSRDIDMLVFGHSGYPVILFPTSEGRYYENKDNGLIDSAAHFLENGLVKIYCPDGIDKESWYNHDIDPYDRVQAHMAYERMIVKDVIDFARYETGSEHVGLAGASLAGYHASNIAFKYPNLVGYLFSMSGIFNIKDFLDDYYDENCYFNNPVDYMPNLCDPWFFDQLKWMDIIIATGTDDSFKGESFWMSDILKEKGIGHHFDIKEGFQHDWLWWRQMFPDYLGRIGR